MSRLRVSHEFEMKFVEILGDSQEVVGCLDDTRQLLRRLSDRREPPSQLGDLRPQLDDLRDTKKELQTWLQLKRRRVEELEDAKSPDWLMSRRQMETTETWATAQLDFLDERIGSISQLESNWKKLLDSMDEFEATRSRLKSLEAEETQDRSLIASLCRCLLRLAVEAKQLLEDIKQHVASSVVNSLSPSVVERFDEAKEFCRRHSVTLLAGATNSTASNNLASIANDRLEQLGYALTAILKLKPPLVVILVIGILVFSMRMLLSQIQLRPQSNGPC